MSQYDPDKQHRRSICLQGHDYTQTGAYFATIVTQGREPLCGDVVDGEMVLNPYGRVAATMWQRIPCHFPHVQLDEWIAMPNFIHGIIVITDTPRCRGDAFPARHSDDISPAHGELSVASQVLYGECVYRTRHPHRAAIGVVGRHRGQFQIGDVPTHQSYAQNHRLVHLAT